MNKGRLNNIVRVAGAGISLAIGSGFATGQVVMQYFAVYGLKGVLGTIVFVMLDIYANIHFIQIGYEKQFEHGNDVYKYYCGKYLGAFYDWFAVIFCYMSFIVMISGAGASLQQQFNIPTWIGSFIMTGLVSVTVAFGFKRMVDIMGRIGPLLIISTLITSVVGLAFGKDAISYALSHLSNADLLRAGHGWLSSAYSFMGYGILWFAGFFARIGKEQKDSTAAKYGAATYSTSLGIAIIVMIVSLWRNYELVMAHETQVPLLVILRQVHPAFAYFFMIVIMISIYSSASPLLWTPVGRIVTEEKQSYKVITILLAILGYVIAQALPFNLLMNYIYTINGYIGGLLLVFILIRSISNWFSNKS